MARPFMDGEERQLRALAAMDAVEDLLLLGTEDDAIQLERLSALVGIVFDAARDAMPKAGLIRASNDKED